MQILVCSWAASRRLHIPQESSDGCRGLSTDLGSESVLKAYMQCSSKRFCTLNMRISELIFDSVRAFPGSSVPFGNDWPDTGAEMLEEGKKSLAIPKHGRSLAMVGYGCCCWSFQCPAHSTFMSGSFRSSQEW